MGIEPRITKFEELRAKTDGQILHIIASALERARRANGNRVAAARACAQAQVLLPLVYHLSDSEREQIEMRLAEFRRALAA